MKLQVWISFPNFTEGIGGRRNYLKGRDRDKITLPTDLLITMDTIFIPTSIITYK